MDRRTILRSLAAIPLAGIGMTFPSPPPDRVDPSIVGSIRDRALKLKALDARQGVGERDHYNRVVHDATIIAKQAYTARCDETLRPYFMESAAWYLSQVGLMAFDQRRHPDAVHWLRVALDCAEQSGNDSMVARVLVLQARQSIYLRHPEVGLPLIARAQHSLSLSASEQAALNALAARGAAKQGDLNLAIGYVNEADNWWAERDVLDLAASPWWGHLDQAHLQGDTASAFGTLSGMGYQTLGPATERLEMAVLGHNASSTRSKALAEVGLALVSGRAGDMDACVYYTEQALTSPRVHSDRLRDKWAGLDAILGEHPTMPRVMGLRDEIRPLAHH